MIRISKELLPQYLEAIGDLLNSSGYDFIDCNYDALYEFIFKHYPDLLPDDSVTLHDIIDDITPELVLEFFYREDDE